MSELVLLFISAALANNLVAAQLLGGQLLRTAAARMSSALAISLLLMLMLLLATPLAYGLEQYVLRPFALEYLRTLTLVLLFLLALPISLCALEGIAPALAQSARQCMPLTIGNSLFLAILLQHPEPNSFLATLLASLAAGFGFALVLIFFTALRERIALLDVPAPFQGPPIELITAGILALAFMGLHGFAN